MMSEEEKRLFEAEMEGLGEDRVKIQIDENIYFGPKLAAAKEWITKKVREKERREKEDDLSRRDRELHSASEANKIARDARNIAFGGLICNLLAILIAYFTLNKEVNRVIEMKPQINTVINNVVEVNEKIDNLDKAIHKIYESFKTENFEEADLGKRLAVIKNPRNPEHGSQIIFVLENIPEENSVQVVDGMGISTPKRALGIESNIIYVNYYEVSPEDLWKVKHYFNIRYLINPYSDKRKLSLDDIS